MKLSGIEKINALKESREQVEKVQHEAEKLLRDLRKIIGLDAPYIEQLQNKIWWNFADILGSIYSTYKAEERKLNREEEQHDTKELS